MHHYNQYVKRFFEGVYGKALNTEDDANLGSYFEAEPSWL